MARLSQKLGDRLKGSQDAALGPWLTFVRRELTLEIKLGEKEKCDGGETVRSLRVREKDRQEDRWKEESLTSS